MRKMSSHIKSQLIESTVQSYFRQYADEVYLGRVTTSEIVSVVHFELLKLDCRMSEGNKGEVYDAIRLFGPEGERDTTWLKLYRPALEVLA